MTINCTAATGARGGLHISATVQQVLLPFRAPGITIRALK
jgi:hypothetical protein